MLVCSVVCAQAQMKMHVIDVGQADAILLEFEKAAVLVDAGGEETGDDRAKEHLISRLNDFFTRRPDLNKTLHAIIVTHAHSDHTKLVMDVLQSFKVKYLYDGGDLSGSGVAQLKKARAFASATAIKYLAVKDSLIGRNGFTPLGLKTLSTSSHADLRFLVGSRGCENQNNNSLVLRVRYKKTTAILTGDAETEGDKTCDEGQVPFLLQRYRASTLLDTDIYKVGHHGSLNATDEAPSQSALAEDFGDLSRQEGDKGPGQIPRLLFWPPQGEGCRPDRIHTAENTPASDEQLHISEGDARRGLLRPHDCSERNRKGDLLHVLG